MRTIENDKTATAVTTKKSKTKLVSIDRTTTEERVVTKWVRAALMVPAEYAALLAEAGACAELRAGSVWKGEEEKRRRQWNCKTWAAYGWKPSRKSELEEILKMDLDTEMTIAIPADDWMRIQHICKALEISTCDWLLAAVQYNSVLKMEKRKGAA